MSSQLTPKSKSLRPTKVKLAAVRLTVAEHNSIKKEASSLEMTISDYLRPMILNKTFIPRTRAYCEIKGSDYV